MTNPLLPNERLHPRMLQYGLHKANIHSDNDFLSPSFFLFLFFFTSFPFSNSYPPARFFLGQAMRLPETP